jgi:nicotinamidase-related amidase
MHLTDTDPYPWPYDQALDGRRLALVIVAAQPHWVDRSIDAAATLAVVDRVRLAVRAAGGRIVLTRHGRARSASSSPVGHRPRLPVESTPDWELVTGPEGEELVIDARGLNGFFGSTLDAELRADGRDQLILAGFASELVVDTTLRGANDRGYECLVVADACAPVDRATGDRALSSVTMSGGIFGAVGTSRSLVEALAPNRSDPPRPTVLPSGGASIPSPTTPTTAEVLR